MRCGAMIPLNHGKEDALCQRLRNNGYPLRNLLNILASVPWPYVSGSARERTSLLFVLAVSGVFESLILMNGSNQEKATLVEMNRRLAVCCRSPYGRNSPKKDGNAFFEGSFFLRKSWLTVIFDEKVIASNIYLS